MNIVTGGDYAKKSIGIVMGKPCIFISPLNINKRLILDNSTVKSYKVMSEGSKKALGRTIVGGIALGGVGALAGAVSGKKKNMLIEIIFKDGKKSILKCDQKFYEAIISTCV